MTQVYLSNQLRYIQRQTSIRQKIRLDSKLEPGDFEHESSYCI